MASHFVSAFASSIASRQMVAAASHLPIETGEELIARANACFLAGQHDQAILYCELALKGPGALNGAFTARVQFCKAASLYEKREFFPAIQIYRKISAAYPENRSIAAHVSTIEKVRSHLLHQSIAKVNLADPLCTLIFAIFAAKKKIFVSKEALQEKIPFYAEELAHYRQSLHAQTLPFGLAVRPIERIGDGLLLKATEKAILPNRLIGLYAGKFELTRKERCDSSSYLWSLSQNGFKLSKKEQEEFAAATGKAAGSELYCLDISATEEGNYTRFINHSATHFNCEGLHVEGEDGSVQVALYSTQKINPGEQLLINYGLAYWKGLGIIPISITPTTFQLDATDQIV